MNYLIILFLFSDSPWADPVSKLEHCDFEAFVNETDPKGLNVRAGPSVKEKILGTIPPIFQPRGESIKIRPEVRVVAARNGWFKIEDAKDNETLMAAFDSGPRTMFKSSGWVSGAKLTVKSMSNRAYLSPNISSKDPFPDKGKEDETFDTESNVNSLSLVSCQGKWVQVRDRRLSSSSTFWLNKICGLQETSCQM